MKRSLSLMKSGSIGFFMLWVSVSSAQNVNRIERKDFQMNRVRRALNIPDIPGYHSLKCDFHIHTIFSDGSVWPDFRVVEAWTEGLDVIAITDHIEVRRYGDYLPADLNLGYQIAKAKAEELNIVLIPGAEISKNMLWGHLNVLFVKDVNKLVNDDMMIQVKEAVAQGAFITWNHPGSRYTRPVPDTTKWWDVQTSLLEKGWLHGIEVFNTDEWYPIALKWCKEKNLTVFSGTDIHTPINYWYDLSDPLNHRAMTLVFSKDRNTEGVKEALFAKRTIGYFGDTFVGSDELIRELFNASVILHPNFRSAEVKGKKTLYAELENSSDLPFILQKTGDRGRKDSPEIIELWPRTIKTISFSEEQDKLEFLLTNGFYDVDKHPLVQIKIKK